MCTVSAVPTVDAEEWGTWNNGDRGHLVPRGRVSDPFADTSHRGEIEE